MKNFEYSSNFMWMEKDFLFKSVLSNLPGFGEYYIDSFACKVTRVRI